MTDRTRWAACGALALVLALAGCGGGTGAVAPASATDVAFAQAMIPHHEQAVQMAELALDPAAQAGPQVQELARQIQAAQAPEIDQMTMWLQAWGAPTAMPGTTSGAGIAELDHSGHDMGGMSVSGMMSEQDMAELGSRSGPAFDELWLQLMIEHHQGAIAMAGQVAADTSDPEVATLAEDIIAAQQSEIAAMQELLR